MDPVSAFGVATGVIGLIPLCGQGFDFVSSVFSAKEDLRDCAFELDVERRKYIGWRTTLGLEGVPDRDASRLLKKKIPEGQQAVVLGCLVGISNAFANSKFLESCGVLQLKNDVPKYSVEIDLPWEPKAWESNTQVFIEQRKRHMNILRRCKFVLRDGKKFGDLSAKLRRYLSTIFNYCTWEFMQVFWSASIPEQILKPGQETNYFKYDPAHMVQQLGKSLKRNDNQQQREGLSLLARAADFRARVKEAEGLRFRPIEDNFKVLSSDWAVPYKSKEIGTMAVGRSDNPTNVYYVEWKSYRTYGGVTEGQLVANIGSLVEIAKIPAPSEFRLLPCLGAFRAADQRYGLVYDLPGHLKAMWDPRWSLRDVSRVRKPRDLLSIIRDSESDIPEGLDLGSRIAFIRKVAQSLLLLHAVGWVHKNICSQSMVFFLARSGYTNGPSTSGRLDFDNPYICGFGESRPEDPDDYLGDVRERAKSKKTYLDLDKQAADDSIFVFRGVSKATYDEPTKQSMMQNPYQHPHKRINPQNLYRSSFDVYSLGCVMLEVGLWQDIRSIEPRYQSDAKRFRDRLIGVAAHELPGQMGKIYANATKSCLEIKETGKTEEQGQRCLRQIIEDLSRCVI